MGYVMRAQVASIAEEKMNDTMPKYNSSKEIQVVWDNLQQQVKLQAQLYIRLLYYIQFFYRIYTRVISLK